MIYFRKEGEMIRNGINLWHSDDKYSRGFILKLWKFRFYCRYSFPQQRWIIRWEAC